MDLLSRATSPQESTFTAAHRQILSMSYIERPLILLKESAVKAGSQQELMRAQDIQRQTDTLSWTSAAQLITSTSTQIQ